MCKPVSNAFIKILINLIVIVTGYCSQCYRNYMEKERRKKEQDFSKFEEKKRQQTDKKKSLKKVFKMSSNARGILFN